jgi:hypothetical protein
LQKAIDRITDSLRIKNIPFSSGINRASSENKFSPNQQIPLSVTKVTKESKHGSLDA